MNNNLGLTYTFVVGNDTYNYTIYDAAGKVVETGSFVRQDLGNDQCAKKIEDRIIQLNQ